MAATDDRHVCTPCACSTPTDHCEGNCPRAEQRRSAYEAGHRFAVRILGPALVAFLLLAGVAACTALTGGLR